MKDQNYMSTIITITIIITLTKGEEVDRAKKEVGMDVAEATIMGHPDVRNHFHPLAL